MKTQEKAPRASFLLYGTESHDGRREQELVFDVIAQAGAGPVLLGHSDGSDTRQLILSGAMLILLGWRAGARQMKFLLYFRQQAPYTPVLVIGISGDNAVRAKAFECGADNYLSPAFSKGELEAKIRRLQKLVPLGALRRPPIAVGPLQIWPDSLVVLQNGDKVRLSRREFSMLLRLARSSPRPVSKATLEREVLGLNHQPGTNVVAVHVHRLRKKICAGGSHLKTVPGAGYKLS